MSLTFNIIYTPGTVHYLTFFVRSLLHWSDCSFRLVANGCSAAEESHLRHFCQQDGRLEFYRLPTDKMIIHGQALNHLHDLTQEDKFCFMDSDIYAIGNFMSQFLPLGQQHACVSACSPIWCKPEEQVSSNLHPILAGEYTHTNRGLCLGVTYFAIYDNVLLTDFRQDTRLGFELRIWEEISHHHQKRLQKLKLRKAIYDTGKLLNLMLQGQGHTIVMQEAETLCHLGGVSDISRIRQNVAQQGQSTPIHRWQNLSQRIYIRLRRLWQPDYYRFGFSQRRALYKLYWGEYLGALVEKRRLPDLPRTGEPEIEARLEVAMQQIIVLYQQVPHENLIPGASILS